MSEESTASKWLIIMCTILIFLPICSLFMLSLSCLIFHLHIM